jgi:hypothetical protein
VSELTYKIGMPEASLALKVTPVNESVTENNSPDEPNTSNIVPVDPVTVNLLPS